MSTLSPSAGERHATMPDDAFERWLHVRDWLVTLPRDELAAIVRTTCGTIGSAGASLLDDPQTDDPVKESAVAQIRSVIAGRWSGQRAG